MLHHRLVIRSVLSFDQVKEATTAVAKLHGRELKPPAPAAKRRGKGAKDAKDAAAAADSKEGPPARLWARQVSGEGVHHKKWRLILRNLPFNVRGLRFASRETMIVPCLLQLAAESAACQSMLLGCDRSVARYFACPDERLMAVELP